MEAVKANGLVLPYIDLNLIDYNIVLEAVKQNGLAIQHAGEFKTDPSICWEAIKQNSMAISLLPPELQKSKEVLMEVYKQNPYGLISIAPEEYLDEILNQIRIQEETGDSQIDSVINIIYIFSILF